MAQESLATAPRLSIAQTAGWHNTDVGEARLQNHPHNTQHRQPLLVLVKVFNFGNGTPTKANHAITIDGKIIGIKERINYIHDNLVRNGLIYEQWEYVYSSAKDYQGLKGLVKIEFAF